MYNLYNVLTDTYARYASGGLKVFMLYRTARAAKLDLNRKSDYPVWQVKRADR